MLKLGLEMTLVELKKTLYGKDGEILRVSFIRTRIQNIYISLLEVASKEYKDKYFDVVFSVSTLEHISEKYRVDVFKDMNRCTREGGRQIHTIDIPVTTIFKSLVYSIHDKLPLTSYVTGVRSHIKKWIRVIEKSGIKIACDIPNTIETLRKDVLVESPDVVFRFIPPNNQVKRYSPPVSLLITIEDV